MEFKNKVVLITGGSSGIGAATAIEFGKQGAHVAISYKDNSKGAEEVVAHVKDVGAEAVAYQADLCDDAQAAALVGAAVSKYGKLDVVVNNAGGYIAGDEWDGEVEVWVESLKQNLVSVMSISKYAVQQFQEQRSGVMVNVSSRYSAGGKDDVLSYAAAKAAIVNITQAYAKLLAPFGRANAISPAAVRAGYWVAAPEEETTETLAKTPLGKLAEPEEIARMIVFLASDTAKNITGQNIFIDGGYTLK